MIIFTREYRSLKLRAAAIIMKNSICTLRLFISKLNGVLQCGFAKLYTSLLFIMTLVFFFFFSHVNVVLFPGSIQDTLDCQYYRF